MRTILLAIHFFLAAATILSAQPESTYTNRINTYFNGQREYPVTNGRVDILTGQYAIEVERAEKWKNAIGQALWYGLQTNRKAGIVLLVLQPSEYKYFQMLNSTLQHRGIADKIKVWQYPADFEGRSAGSNAPSSYGATLRSTQPANSRYWITTSSRKRHNRSCRYFRNSKGKYGSANEGIACKICGGD